MTKCEIAALAYKVAGFALVAYGFVTCTTPLAMLLAGGSLGLAVAFPLVLGIAWLIAGFFAHRWSWDLAVLTMPDDPTPVASVDITAEDVLSLASGAIGIWIAGPLLVTLGGNAIALILASTNDPEYDFATGLLYSFLPQLPAIMVAVWFLFGSRGIARFIARARLRDIAATAAPAEQENES